MLSKRSCVVAIEHDDDHEEDEAGGRESKSDQLVCKDTPTIYCLRSFFKRNLLIESKGTRVGGWGRVGYTRKRTKNCTFVK